MRRRYTLLIAAFVMTALAAIVGVAAFLLPPGEETEEVQELGFLPIPETEEGETAILPAYDEPEETKEDGKDYTVEDLQGEYWCLGETSYYTEPDKAAPVEGVCAIGEKVDVLGRTQRPDGEWFLALVNGTDSRTAFLPGGSLSAEDPYGEFREQRSYPVEIRSARISAMNGSVKAMVKSGAEVPASDDGIYRLVAQGVWQSGAEGTEIAQAPAAAGASFIFPLAKGTQESCLFRRLLVCVQQGGSRIPVSDTAWLNNPEEAADKAVARLDHGIKGILPAASLLDSGGLGRLGVDQVTYNVPIGDVCSGGGIGYTYNGKNYSFSSAIVGQYDVLVPKLSAQGIQITLIFLLNGNAGSLIHPDARGTSANYYAFNTTDQESVEKLAAVASFFADRYTDNGRGTVDNWIVGNEINARAAWHSMNTQDLETFTQAYADAFRIFYAAVTGENANARVYTCIDNQWAQATDPARYFPGRDFLACFNRKIISHGNLDYGLAVHPYNEPLTESRAWLETAKAIHSVDSPSVTMANVDVVTDYCLQSGMRKRDGEVRSILLSEVGYSSGGGSANQAASIVFAYLQAKNNEYVDGFILAREMDHYHETSQGLHTGIISSDGSRKSAWSYYQAMGTAEEEAYVVKAQETMGVADLYSLLTPRRTDGNNE